MFIYMHRNAYKKGQWLGARMRLLFFIPFICSFGFLKKNITYRPKLK